MKLSTTFTSLRAEDFQHVSQASLRRLNFPKALERYYRHHRQGIGSTYEIWMMVALLAGLWLLGWVGLEGISPQGYAEVEFFQYRVGLPIVVVWCVLFFVPRVRRYALQLSLCFGIAFAITLLSMHVAVWRTGFEMPYQSLMLGSLLFQFVGGATWRVRSVVNLLLIIIFICIEIVFQHGYMLFIQHIVLMLCAFLGAVSGSYMYEYSIRKAFLSACKSRIYADIDPLTGLVNRRILDDRLARLWRQAVRDKKYIAIAMVDIDFFKKYNDFYGHLAGDEVLRRVSDVLSEQLTRPFDIVARYGGEEFTIVWYDPEPELLPDLAEYLRLSIASLHIDHKGSEVGELRISVGVAHQRPSKGSLPENLLLLADQMLYKAKQSGRDCVCIADMAAFSARALEKLRRHAMRYLAARHENVPEPANVSAHRLDEGQRKRLQKKRIRHDLLRVRWIILLVTAYAVTLVLLNHFSINDPAILAADYLKLAFAGILLGSTLVVSFLKPFQSWMHLIIAIASLASFCVLNLGYWLIWQAGFHMPYESMLVGIFISYFTGAQSWRSALLVNLLGCAMFVFVVFSANPPFFSINAALMGVLMASLFGSGIGWIHEQRYIADFLSGEETRRFARRDELTGLGNRRELSSALVRLYDQAIIERKSLAVAILDIDYFKAYNDHYGHNGGDTVLMAVGHALRKLSRRGFDAVARYGGEEFVLVWYDVQLENATLIGEQVRACIEALDIEHTRSPLGKITVSVGIAYGNPTEGGVGENSFLSSADRALYLAKNNGRNRVEFTCLAPSAYERVSHREPRRRKADFR